VYLFDVIKRHFTAWRLGRFGHRSHDHPVDRYLEQTENTVNYFPNIFTPLKLTHQQTRTPVPASPDKPFKHSVIQLETNRD
jgi:hypothetical protein